MIFPTKTFLNFSFLTYNICNLYLKYIFLWCKNYSTSVCEETLDEAPQAYKSIEEIKNAITDTVEIIDTIKPIYNFKSH